MATYIRYQRNLRQYISSNLAFSQSSDKAHFFLSFISHCKTIGLWWIFSHIVLQTRYKWSFNNN